MCVTKMRNIFYKINLIQTISNFQVFSLINSVKKLFKLKFDCKFKAQEGNKNTQILIHALKMSCIIQMYLITQIYPTTLLQSFFISINQPLNRVIQFNIPIFYSNISLLFFQCQAIVVGFLASLFAMIMGWIPEGEFNMGHALLLCASSLVTASLASLILGEFSILVNLYEKKKTL